MSDPVVTRIERQKRNNRRVSVFLDDAFAFGLEEEVAFRHQLAKGTPVPPAFAARLQEESLSIEAKRASERLLSARMRSEQELRSRLQRRDFPDGVIDAVIADFRRVGMIDDLAFAEAFVRDRIRLRPRSRSLLLRELRSKGVSDDVAARAVERQSTGDMDAATAFSLLRSYMAKHPTTAADLVRRRAFAYLQRRGYSVGVILSAFRAVGMESSDAVPSQEDV